MTREECESEDFLGRFCAARACTVKHEVGYIMCTPHWAMVSPDVQRRIIRCIGSLRTQGGDVRGLRGKLGRAIRDARRVIEQAESKEQQAQVDRARVARRAHAVERP